jgi:tRNA A37 threonylcarbamoyladenosine modification protein TsaB
MKTTLFIISIANPILIGIYKNGILTETIEKEGKTSDILPHIVNQILEKQTIDEIIYVNGPGSYMSIKIAYIFLKTLSITLDVPFLAISGFDTNGNSPIKALGQKYFFLDINSEIKMRSLELNEIINNFVLPEEINYELCFADTLPNYQLPAVY